MIGEALKGYLPQDAPYMNEAIIGNFSSFDVQETKIFKGMEEAVSFTRLSAKRIARCIDTGSRWGCWTFDLA